jgi:hypothetical protein
MRFAILPLLTLALVACGSSGEGDKTSEDDTEVGRYEIENGETRASITDEDGSVTTLRAGERVPVRLPRGFTVAPGLTVLNNTHVERDGGAFVLLSMQGEVQVDDVIAYYRKQAEAAGIEVQVDIKAEESTTIAGESDDGLAFSVHASRNDHITAVQLTLNQGLK